jgi:hypothetical protein
MRSTTGAYGDFPDYYYGSGNLFGSYLLGKAPAMSRDTRRELEVLEGGFAVSLPRPKPVSGPKRTAHDELMSYARTCLSPQGAMRVVAALAASRGVPIPERNRRTPFDLLDDFAFRHLSPEDQLRIRIRLEQSVREIAAADRRQRAAEQSRKERSRKPGSSRRTSPAAPAIRKHAPHADACALCGASLTEAEQLRCRADSEAFVSQVYCTEHADKVKALFRGQG